MNVESTETPPPVGILVGDNHWVHRGLSLGIGAIAASLALTMVELTTLQQHELAWLAWLGVWVITPMIRILAVVALVFSAIGLSHAARLGSAPLGRLAIILSAIGIIAPGLPDLLVRAQSII